jgi:hypothetical protein
MSEFTPISSPSSPYIVLESQNELFQKSDLVDYVLPLTPSENQQTQVKNGKYIPFLQEQKKKNMEVEPETPFFTLNSDIASKIPKDPPKLPLLTNIYVGTLTVVGLFVLYRMLTK